MITFPKDTAQVSWTRHIKNKMVFYHLSGSQILRIFRKPDRREEGIAPGTVAAMQRKTHNSQKTTDNQKQKRQEEIWIMYKIGNRKSYSANCKAEEPASDTRYKLHASRITMISAWRYPGTTKAGERPEIPADVLDELAKMG